MRNGDDYVLEGGGSSAFAFGRIVDGRAGVRGDGRFIVNLFIRFETIERGISFIAGNSHFPVFVRRSELS